MAKVYPDTAIPSTAEADALDSTIHVETGVPFVVKGDNDGSTPTLNQQENRVLWRILELLAAVSQGKVDDETTALNIGVRPCYYKIGGTAYEYDGVTGQAVANNDTSYVYLQADGLHVVTDAVGWPGDPLTYVPLAEVTAASGVITLVKDVRMYGLDPGTAITNLASTTSATLQLLSGTPGPKLKAETATKFGLRNAADGAYVDLQALIATFTDLIATGTLTLTGAATLGSTAALAGAWIQLLSGTPGPKIKATGATTVAIRDATDAADADLTAAAGTFSDDVGLAAGKTLTIAANSLIVPYTPSVYVAGAMTVRVLEGQWVAPVAGVLIAATGRATTAPTGDSLICDVRQNGASIFANQAAMINIADGTYTDTSATVDIAFVAGDVFTFEVEQVGLVIAGSDLSIMLNCRVALQE